MQHHSSNHSVADTIKITSVEMFSIKEEKLIFYNVIDAIKSTKQHFVEDVWAECRDMAGKEEKAKC